ncbi:DUF945 family protein [Salinicola halophilus]|uniref:DUF945 family protein n=1 Tax=Salinicola halophilus TaxID=184065 RepID=UPI000DA25F22|nr:DUF945 family protein [Salinicola halophilus]
MHRGVVAIPIVAAVLGASYLGGLIYASHRFEQEAATLTARLDASRDWRVEREAVERGWFHSQGRLVAQQMALGRPTGLVVATDYTAGHGVLRTSLEGRSEIRGDDETLFGDWLDAEAPLTWQGQFETLAQRVEMALEVPAFHHAFPAQAAGPLSGALSEPQGEVDVDFGGLTLTLGQANGTLDYTGELPSLEFDDGLSSLALERTQLSGEISGDADAFSQRAALVVPRATLARSGLAPVEIERLEVETQATLDETLAATVTFSLGDARMRDQALLAGNTTLTLDRIDGDAYRAFIAAWQRHLGRIDQAVQRGAPSEEIIAMSEPGEAIWSALIAMLAGSPHLALETLSLQSELLGMQTTGRGELTLDGDGLARQFDADGQQALGGNLGRRFEGELELENAPAFLKLYLGVGMESDPLLLTLDDGVLTLDGNSMVLIPARGEAPIDDVPDAATP